MSAPALENSICVFEAATGIKYYVNDFTRELNDLLDSYGYELVNGSVRMRDYEEKLCCHVIDKDGKISLLKLC